MNELYEPFENAEEVWFWYCACLEARGDGRRAGGGGDGPRRPCELCDIERIIKYLRSSGSLRPRQLRVMLRWGCWRCSPYYDRRASRIEVRLWDEGIRSLEPWLRAKNIIRNGEGGYA